MRPPAAVLLHMDNPLVVAEMPSSMDAVRAQLEDVPHDSKDPLFPIGSGLFYSPGN